jgi:hypothetical protein
MRQVSPLQLFDIRVLCGFLSIRAQQRPALPAVGWKFPVLRLMDNDVSQAQFRSDEECRFLWIKSGFVLDAG